MNFDEWMADVNGRVVGDGQCWTLAQDCYSRVYGGGPLYTHPSAHPGYAIGVWDGYGANGTEAIFDKAPATAIALPGWFAIWHYGSVTAPESHIAMTIGDYGLGVECMSQNPGGAHKRVIPKLGLAGYLVPKTGGKASGFTANLASDTSGGGNGGVAGAVDSVTKLADSVATVQHFFAQPGQWQRIGIYALGALILFSAVIYMFKDNVTDLAKAI